MPKEWAFRSARFEIIVRMGNWKTFSIATDRKDGLLKVSSVGYETRYIDVRQGSVGDIAMQSNMQELGEVEVNAIKPTHKLTTEGIMTTVEHTLLSKAGTANDVLQNLPGVQKKQDGIEVFGKGTPIIYINGRQMRNKSELEPVRSRICVPRWNSPAA